MNDVNTSVIKASAEMENTAKQREREREGRRTAQIKDGRGNRLTLVFACFFFP